MDKTNKLSLIEFQTNANSSLHTYMIVLLLISDRQWQLRMTQHKKLLSCKNLLIAVIGFSFIYYLYAKTPFFVYVLDRLNLRYFFLPNFQCESCTNIKFGYLTNSSSPCQDEPVFLLILVLTYHSNAEARKVIRDTWGGVRQYRGVNIQTRFVFGLHHDVNLNNQPHYESNVYGDVIQVQLYDHYRSLTEKVLMALDWSSKHCNQAKYVLKTDDDSFNHPARFVDYLLDVQHNVFIGGYCFTVYPDYRESSKHYINPNLYPYVYYPTYCSGPGYVLSKHAIAIILQNYQNVKYLPMEDVFITGMIRETMGMKYTQIPGVVAGWHTLTPCLLATETKNAHNIWPSHMKQIWVDVLKNNPDVCKYHLIKNMIILIIVICIWCILLIWMLKCLAWPFGRYHEPCHICTNYGDARNLEYFLLEKH